MPDGGSPTKNDATGSCIESAIRRKEATEGLARPRSTWDRKLSDTPAATAASRSVMPFFRRTSRMR